MSAHPVTVHRAKHGYYVAKCSCPTSPQLFVLPTAAQAWAEAHELRQRLLSDDGSRHTLDDVEAALDPLSDPSEEGK